MADATGAYRWLILALAARRVDPRQGNAMCQALAGFVASLRDGELERRIEMLEAARGRRGGGRT
jgi:hypothetical protein